MPIEFPCPVCSRQLRTPDESAGKKAKCPQCGAVADVPLTSNLAGPEGSPDMSPPAAPWTPMASGGEEAPPPKPFPLADSTSNPYASPGTLPSMSGDTRIEEPARLGLPWEARSKSLKTFWETSMLILGSPADAFQRMLREGGLGTPIGFMLAGGLIGACFNGLYNTLLQLVLLLTVGAQGQNAGPFQGASWVQVAVQFPMALVSGTLGAIIGSFIAAGIYHLFLMILGGAKFGFETTYRVVAYVSGATALILMVPICGPYAMILAGIIYPILGLSAAHRIGGGRAAAAVLLPIVVCGLACGLALLAVIAFGVSTIVPRQ